MKLFIFCVFILSISTKPCTAQSAPNMANSSKLSPTTQKESQLSTVPINIFTGVPQVGVPIYSYNSSNNGLSFKVSLDYFAGGVQVAESPTTTGLGWYLNAGGAVTRTIRGAPDDMPLTGFLYAGAIPTDFRPDGNKYYFDSLDAQQDVFQYNFNGRSGKFYIGKNGQVAMLPVSKLKIIPIIGTDSLAQRIVAFRIITEDGEKFDFKNAETSSISSEDFYYDGYFDHKYFSSWSLSQVISAFNTDTIKFNYIQRPVYIDFAFPQTTFVRSTDGVRTRTFAPVGTNMSTINKISSILFPGKTTVSFIYSYNYEYSGGDLALSRIKVSDSVFRYGYVLDYQPNYRLNLNSITPYTSRQKKEAYSFVYNTPLFQGLGSLSDTIQNKRDYWGYFNGAINGTNLIPKVNGYSWGANRNPDINFAMANSLSNFYLPGGANIFYEYELNDHYPYRKDPQKLTVFPTAATNNTATFSQVFKTKHQLTFILDSTVNRQGVSPLAGTGNMQFNIKSLDGTVTYATYTLSLFDLFYQGIKAWAFNVPNGTYRIEQLAASGTTVTGSFPIYINWENKLTDSTQTKVQCGGLRVKRITRKNAISAPPASVEEYRYVNTDGTSSGFLGDIPKFDYPYQETVNFNGTRTTSYTAVSSEPVNNMNYAQGSPVGYSRVEVVEGTAGHNIGKTVYEFTSLQDVNAGFNTAVFPYTPPDLKDWGIGLPKLISVFDSAGTLVKKTVKNYGFDSASYVNSNFKSIKTGNIFTQYNGDSSLSATPRMRTYIGLEYYPVSGRSYIVSSVDSLFHANGSVNSTYTNFSYDSNYNVIKIVSGYDRNRGLQLEKRLYYPYNYTIAGAIGKLRDSSIITPVIASENWITGDASPRIVSGNISDYQQITGGYVKPLAVYSLQANQPLSQTLIGIFNPALVNRNATYFVKQNNFIIYDAKANLLQAQNAISGINNSIIMDYGQQYAVAKVSNAAVSDIAYSSFEADGSGNWAIASALRDTINAITGKKSYNLTNGNITKSGLSSTQAYLVTVWAKTGAVVNINAVALSTVTATQGNWNLFATQLSGITSLIISGTGLIDELRLHPKDANMITSTYEPLVGVTSMADANNTIMYNEYDNLNRLKLVRDKDKNILKRYDYADSNMLITLTPSWSITTETCQGTGSSYTNTILTDINPFSDTYGATTSGTRENSCLCTSDPLYKTINGICELALRQNTSTTWIKYNNIWQWRCIYHYQWSDYSVMPDQTEYNSSPCQLTQQ